MTTTKQKGLFALSLKAISLQFATLMEDVGGKQTVALLDGLADLAPENRDKLVSIFLEATSQISATENKQVDISKFESELYDGIIADFEQLQSERKSESKLVSLEEFKSRAG